MQYRITEIELEHADQDIIEEVMTTTKAINSKDLVDEITLPQDLESKRLTTVTSSNE